MNQINRLLTNLLKYRCYKWFGYNKYQPITLTYSVTAACQSNCKTCQIGKMYQSHPERIEDDLKIEEIERIFASMKPVYFFNISGGEPFLRKDLPEIVELACKYLKPRVIHTPTNAILSDRIYKDTYKILEIVNRYDATVPFTVKPSIDGIGELHDEIRGIKGNFKKLISTIENLKEIEKKFKNFHLELGTVISIFNIDYLEEIENLVHSLNVESYRNEVAEQRTEFFNVGDPITPDATTYQELIKNFVYKIEKDIGSKRSLAKNTEALRVVYYEIAGRILSENRQIIPCYAGVSNVHINYDGGVWPCCVLGYSKQMGNLRETNYDFQKLWVSEKSNEIRSYIKNKNCACPLANQSYSNIMMNIPSLINVIKKIIIYNMKSNSG